MITPANTPQPAIARLSRAERGRGIDRLRKNLQLYVETGNKEFLREAIAIADCLKESNDA